MTDAIDPTDETNEGQDAETVDEQRARQGEGAGTAGEHADIGDTIASPD